MLKGVGLWAFKDQVFALIIFAAATSAFSVLRLRRQSR
jgi:hypothetical protein